MKHYTVEFYSATVQPTKVQIETDGLLSTKQIRIKLRQMGFADVCLVWVSGLK